MSLCARDTASASRALRLPSDNTYCTSSKQHKSSSCCSGSALHCQCRRQQTLLTRAWHGSRCRVRTCPGATSSSRRLRSWLCHRHNAGAQAATDTGTGTISDAQNLSVGRPLIPKPAGPLRCPADPGVDHASGSECVTAQNCVIEQLPMECTCGARTVATGWYALCHPRRP
jgi:hypothetical protein